jgi:cell wall-associated NlpC family hydrolase
MGGAEAGFDCSGLVKWCFAQVGVDFTHKAHLIMRDDQVRCSTSVRAFGSDT